MRKLWLIAALMFLLPFAQAQTEVQWMDKETVRNWLGRTGTSLLDVPLLQDWARSSYPIQMMILDVRSTQDWAASEFQIRGATHKDPAQVSSWGTSLPKDRAIIVYCASPQQQTSAQVAQTLVQLGYPAVGVLKGGFSEWEQAGYPLESKKPVRLKQVAGRFRPGDAALVDDRLSHCRKELDASGQTITACSDACKAPADCREEISADGQRISFGPHDWTGMANNYEYIAWDIWNWKTSQEAINWITQMRAQNPTLSLNPLLSHPDRTIINRIDSPDEALVELIEGARYEYVHVAAYREFTIGYAITKREAREVLQENWPTILENAKKLIDSRFPAGAEEGFEPQAGGGLAEQESGYAAVLSLLGILAAVGFGALGPLLAGAGSADAMEPLAGETVQPASTPGTHVPCTEEHRDRLTQLSIEITDPGLYAQLAGLLDQVRQTGSIDAEALAELEGRQQQWADARHAQNVAQQEQAAGQRRAEAAQDLIRSGYVYNEATGAWSFGGKEEFDNRVRWIENNTHRLTAEQQAAVDRILGGTRQTADLTLADLERVRGLSGAVHNILTGQSEAQGAAAQIDAIDAEHWQEVAGKLADAGKAAAGLVEATFIPATRGAISGFIFNALQSRDQGAVKAIKMGLIGAGSNFIGSKLGSARQGDVLWNAGVSGLTNAAESGLKGESAESMAYAAAFGAATGGLFEHLQNVQARNGGKLFSFGNEPAMGGQRPRIQSGDDPTLKLGSRGVGSNDLPGRTSDDIRLDLEYQQNMREGQRRVEAFGDAVRGTDMDKIRDTMRDVLEHRGAKNIIKGDSVSKDLKNVYANVTEQYRTKPVFEGTAYQLNSQKLPDGGDRYYVRSEDGAERPVKMEDFTTGSGTAGKSPGIDFDLYAQNTIVDRTTGKPVAPDILERAVNRASENLGFDPKAQETNVMHALHQESYPIKPGETPKEFIERAGSWDKWEAQRASDVSAYKGEEAERLHGSADALSEQCRGSMKDFNRITKPMAEATADVRIPAIFTRSESGTGKSALEIMQEVGNGTMSPGLGNARFRELTGMSLADGTVKLNSLAEAIVKLRAPSTGRS